MKKLIAAVVLVLCSSCILPPTGNHDAVYYANVPAGHYCDD